MKTPIFIFFGILTGLTPAAHAAFTNAKCEYTLSGSGNIQINRQWDVEKRSCFISLTPRNIEDLKYRDYYFDNLGEFMVFNSYGDGPPSSKTGARDYFVLPLVNEYPDYSVEENGDVIVKMVSGHQLRVSAVDFSIVSFTPGAFTELPLSPKNKGGLEIKPSEGYWIDAGFKLGGVHFANPRAQSTIWSARSTPSCKLTNKEFLGYDSNSNYGFKYKGEELKKFLASKCSKLEF